MMMTKANDCFECQRNNTPNSNMGNLGRSKRSSILSNSTRSSRSLATPGVGARYGGNAVETGATGSFVALADEMHEEEGFGTNGEWLGGLGHCVAISGGMREGWRTRAHRQGSKVEAHASRAENLEEVLFGRRRIYQTVCVFSSTKIIVPPITHLSNWNLPQKIVRIRRG
jgi:hypothetical protein